MGAFARGCYIQLLNFQWQEGSLPEDPLTLGELAGINSSEVDTFRRDNAFATPGSIFVDCVWPWLEDLFPVVADDMRQNRRLEQERVRYERKESANRDRTLLARAERKRRQQVASVTEARQRVDADADADEEEEMSAGADAPPNIMSRWNELAEKYGLVKIRTLAGSRLVAVRKRLKEVSGLWEELGGAIAERGTWARSRRFPSFDQAMRPSTLMRLLEGNYVARPGEEQDDERTILILALQGRQIGQTVATKEGLEGSHGVEPWKEISTERLRNMSDLSLSCFSAAIISSSP